MKHNILEQSIKDVKEMDKDDITSIKTIHDMRLREEELKQRWEDLKFRQEQELNKLAQAKLDRKFKWDWNLLANGAISLTTILLVLNYEQSNIITSKSWNIANKWIGRG